MTASSLPAALRAAAEGLYALEAATGRSSPTAPGSPRDDFAGFIHHGAGTAAIDWEAAIGALDIRASFQARPERTQHATSWQPASPTGRPSAWGTQSPASTNATPALPDQVRFGTPSADASSHNVTGRQ